MSGCMFGGQFPLTRSSSSFRRDDRISLAPFEESKYASASPIPDEAPVSQMTLFLRSGISLYAVIDYNVKGKGVPLIRGMAGATDLLPFAVVDLGKIRVTLYVSIDLREI